MLKYTALKSKCYRITLISLTKSSVYCLLSSIVIWTSLAYCYCSLDLLILAIASVSKAISHIAANAYCANLVQYTVLPLRHQQFSAFIFIKLNVLVV